MRYAVVKDPTDGYLYVYDTQGIECIADGGELIQVTGKNTFISLGKIIKRTKTLIAAEEFAKENDLSYLQARDNKRDNKE